MMEDLYPYPEMKHAAMSWLPTIPAHWQVHRNGQLFGVRKETGYPDLPVLEVSLHTVCGSVTLKTAHASSR
jgi:type I restriction enzyme S subunit